MFWSSANNGDYKMVTIKLYELKQISVGLILFQILEIASSLLILFSDLQRERKQDVVYKTYYNLHILIQESDASYGRVNVFKHYQ